MTTVLNHASPFKRNVQLTDLPTELISAILIYLDSTALKRLNLTSKWGYHNAIPLLWRHVELVDKCTDYKDVDKPQMFGADWGFEDKHDDTPIIQKVLVILHNPFIASSVQSITHRCHLPHPGIFNELPNMYFKSRTLSSDRRTSVLLADAICLLDRVHTLRIVYGHWNLTKCLLKGFLFDRPASLKRLWLENVSLEGLPLNLLQSSPRSCGLESIRLRRLHLYGDRPPYEQSAMSYILVRGAGESRDIANGRAGTYSHPMVYSPEEEILPTEALDVAPLDVASEYDKRIYYNLPSAFAYLANRGYQPVNNNYETPFGNIDPCTLTTLLLHSSADTLTSLTLDWILWPSDNRRQTLPFLDSFSRLYFPNLKAFQLRNTVLTETELPKDLYLLDSSEDGSSIFPTFIEKHKNLRCLAWPIDRFFGVSIRSPEDTARRERIVAELARTLEDLRVDAEFGRREPFTHNPVGDMEFNERTRRRRFIEDFASHMTKVKSIKLEGGIPRDEKRETIRALSQSPLEKVIAIGISCPVGNTWGAGGRLLQDIDGGVGIGDDTRGLQEEYDDIIEGYMSVEPSKPFNEQFHASYGWGPGPPFVHNIASYHASTVTELKFCGYNGAPILYRPTPITEAMLHPIRYFHKLKSLVLSMWLLTWHEDEFRDDSIIQFWQDRSSPTSTALALPLNLPVLQPLAHPPPFTPAANAALINHRQNAAATHFSEPRPSWSQTLQTIYTPEALAAQVARQVGPHISEQAKAQREGVHVRVSFCLGLQITDIFELDVWIGAGDEVLRTRGPRTEQDGERREDKLFGRRWF
ncbi:hypothetical protein EJ05DRAFT_394825 [Pseudovirgaria hyperparasitica]|uniref:F-box domain-containing protein n=1 Tax=Pseudovirgaria hyperparasitica TaxID=470096 RepID=A0A6A6W911_9PEZI|nr:uncharacterized protein EJ05DRAFT_394825 [Pseudovirgaria hyperparasitica]KAF2757581.1 hypothetical protein EJ05DRAFT_394825 [Pseudovirgaria hyperparasitica]